MASPIAQPPDALMAVVARLLGPSQTSSAAVNRPPYEAIPVEILT